MNKIVVDLNSKLKDAATRAGPQVIFVDWNTHVDALRGRYCQPFVKETDVNHDSAAFYYRGTTADDEGTTILPQSLGNPQLTLQRYEMILACPYRSERGYVRRSNNILTGKRMTLR